MGKMLKVCRECNRYTLGKKEKGCHHCGGQLRVAAPPKFSPVKAEKYGKYRRILLKETLASHRKEGD